MTTIVATKTRESRKDETCTTIATHAENRIATASASEKNVHEPKRGDHIRHEKHHMKQWGVIPCRRELLWNLTGSGDTTQRRESAHPEPPFSEQKKKGYGMNCKEIAYR